MEVLTAVRNELQANSDEKTRKSGKRFFKEEIKLYGVQSAVVQKIAKQYFADIKNLPKKEIFELCTNLWQSGYMEASFVACNWSYAIHKQYEENDIEIFEQWLKNYVSNWASCDTLCNHTIGTLVTMYPHLIARLKTWAQSDNRWVKRGSAVTLIIPARNGLFQTDIFEIADILLLDSDDLVQKGYGWMLKAASQHDEQKIFEYVMHNKDRMPRIALRYAIEKLPTDLRKKAMMK